MTILEKIAGRIGLMTASLVPLRNSSGLFFFFPFFHVGGAERVHAEIVACFAEERPWVFFAKRSCNDAFRSLFARGGRLFNLWWLLKYSYPVSAGVLAGIINRHGHPVVFGCNSLFFYKMIPFLEPHVRVVDLIHAFGGGAEEFSRPVVGRLDARVIITGATRDDMAAQYERDGIPFEFLERVVLIENQVPIPSAFPPKGEDVCLRAIFVGRGSEEKRVRLVGRIASACRAQGLPVSVTLVGDVSAGLDDADLPSCHLTGEVTDAEALAAIYDQADLLLLTSSREGFPLVVMEAMAHGVVPLCTRVGGIPAHVRHGENGMLVESGSEEQIVNDFVACIGRLCRDTALRQRLAREAYVWAAANFGAERFCRSYRALLLGERGSEAPCPR
ncbi:glycosyltransferase family 4 protein [Geobacter hydrogenophilus]|uniref:Glycosyl transferase family 1 domain-containing protein n=1 Tax=Geobacter hydrogenophilus TaxID=40983 RepID=A0A9W6FYV9_9BACT|nr:glycosyltransferase family 4 protein [Geobacter hydrogenophilus]MBT0894787.1 glycosyltransferase family 4 protein [Geobacter hydrogenophilus]GLI37375.1 hypothetical protein GHYDROH2_08760 [Geobacter hydrogenophilus]